MAEILEKTVTIPGPAGSLQGRIWQPEAPERSLVIVPATGVPAGYYAAFAAWAAATQNAAVLTFDYRDFGATGGAQVRVSPANMADWGVSDAHAARLWLKRRFSALPLWLLGHSLGGMVVPFQPDCDQIDRLITLGAGQVHWRDHPWPMQGKAFGLWFGFGPALTAGLGYLPGKRLGLGADIPKEVFWQWRRWSITPGSCLADPQMPSLKSESLTCPVTLNALSDDDMIPPEASWKLADWMPKATVTRRLHRPADYGLSAVGHIAAFAPRNRALWPAIMAP